MHGIRKAFPGVVALDGVDLTLHRGEVHMLLGENGAGKSTLMKILSGAYRKDEGRIAVDGKDVEIQSPRDALALGIRVIYQELNLIPHLSVAENIFLGAAPTRAFGIIDWRRLSAAASQLLADLGMNLSPDTPLDQLSLAQRQMVEIAKALEGSGVDPRDGRADVRADVARGRSALRLDRAPDRTRRRHRLHHASARRGLSNRPARVGAPRRPARHDPTAVGRHGRRARAADGQSRGRRSLSEAAHRPGQGAAAGRRTGTPRRAERHQLLPSRRRGRRHRGAARRRPERAGARDRRRRSIGRRQHPLRRAGHALPHAGGCDSAGHRPAAGRSQGRGPRRGADRGAQHRAAPRPAAGALGVPAARLRRAPGRADREGPARQGHAHAGSAAAERRQSAEGRARQVAGRRRAHLHLRRAHARRRRRREDRDLSPDQPPDGLRRGHHHDLVGAAGAARHERSHSRDVPRPHPRGVQRRRGHAGTRRSSCRALGSESARAASVE